MPTYLKHVYHPARVIKETLGLPRITMYADNCRALSFIMECAAADLRRRNCPKFADGLLEAAAVWRATGSERDL